MEVGKRVMQTTKTMFDEMVSWRNLYKAYKKALRGKKHKEMNQKFMFYCESALAGLKIELVNNTYKTSPYKYFQIYIPKERTISVAAFRDRIVHHALINVIEPIYERVFIDDSYATRKKKGMHKAVYRAQQYAQFNKYYLKLDIKKYFDSINHDVLNELLADNIHDKRMYQLIKQIIATHTTENSCGLPIGNLSSQFFGNVYLDKADHFIKEKGFNHHVRYMDDIVVFSDSSDKLKMLFKELEEFLLTSLKLRIKEKSVQLNYCNRGLPFLGFRIFPDYIRLQNVNIKRMKKKIKEKEYLYKIGRITENAMANSVNSTLAFIKTANTFKLRERIWG